MHQSSMILSGHDYVVSGRLCRAAVLPASLLTSLVGYLEAPIAHTNAAELLHDKTLVAWITPANLTRRRRQRAHVEKPGSPLMR